MQSKLADDTTSYKVNFKENTIYSMRQYGFERFSLLRDPGYGYAYDKDPNIMSTILSSTASEFDFQNPITGEKSAGIIPYLKARVEDQQNFYLECHFLNPHDTQNFYQNLSQEPQTNMLQYKCPYLEEQLKLYNIESPYKFSKEFPDAYVTNPNLVENFFEKTFKEYKTKSNSLPFEESFKLGYVSDPEVGYIIPYLVGAQEIIRVLFTLAENKEDLANWKNLINNYYGLIIEVDTHIYNVLKFLEMNNMLKNTNIVMVSDHGDMMSSFGLKQKIFPHKTCMNVPCLIYSPNLKKSLRGTKCNTLCSLVEIKKILTSLQFNKFSDNSLFMKSSDNKIKLNINYKKRFFHICNSFLSQLSYFTFLGFIKKNGTDNIQKVPKNFFEYQSNFILTIANYNGKEYKYGIYYSIIDLLKCNLKGNIFINSDVKFPALKKSLPIEFTFNEGYLIIRNNTELLFEYIIFITSKISNNGLAKLKLPTKGDKFLYDLTKNNPEIYNLANSQPGSIHEMENRQKILQFMEQELILAAADNKMLEPITILQINQFKELLKLIKILTRFFSEKLEDLDETKLILLATLVGKNNMDDIGDQNGLQTKMSQKYNEFLENLILNEN